MTWVFKLARRIAGNHRSIAVAALALTTVACGADGSSNPVLPGPNTPGAPVPGWLTIQLTTPHNDNGAVQLRISGAVVQDVEAVAPYDGFGTTDDGIGRMVVTGDLKGGSLVRFKVPDVAAAQSYRVTVEAAAQRDSYELRDLAGYQAVVVR